MDGRKVEWLECSFVKSDIDRSLKLMLKLNTIMVGIQT